MAGAEQTLKVESLEETQPEATQPEAAVAAVASPAEAPCEGNAVQAVQLQQQVVAEGGLEEAPEQAALEGPKTCVCRYCKLEVACSECHRQCQEGDHLRCLP